MVDKKTFFKKIGIKIYHRQKIRAIKRARRRKLKLPDIPESLEKIIYNEIDLFRDKDYIE